MCTEDGGPARAGLVPHSAAEALRMAHAGLDYLNSPAGAELEAAGMGEALACLGGLQAKFTAAHAGLLRRFDGAGAHDGDGYPTSGSWLAAMAQMTRPAARAAVAEMRRLGQHAAVAAALAAGQVSRSYGLEIAGLTGSLPAGLRDRTDEILLAAAAGGADPGDLKVIAAAALEKWKSQRPDPDGDDGFDDRYVQVGTTFGGAACIRGNLTPECGAAVAAVLDALGKRHGPEDTRTEGQRFHDALQLGCELLIRARMVPGRAGAGTHVIVHAPLGQLRQMPGASAIEAAWLAARAGQPGYLAGPDARTAACDALTIPVVTGHADMTIIDRIIELALAAHGTAGTTAADPAPASHGGQPGSGKAGSGKPRPLSPEAWAALRYAIARLAADFVSGPAGLASALRTGLLPAPYNTPSLPLDIGYSDSVPAHIRRAVLLRDKACAWPRCGRPAAWCDVHHITHKQDGGTTSISQCVLLCQFHHDVCIHRWGWQIILHPDGTTEARGPHGQILRSHAPPTLRAG